MVLRHLSGVLSLIQQGLTVGVEYGTHSIEALLWVAESVEEGVYESGSLRRTADGIAFALDNPPLRAAAFASVAVQVDGVPVSAENARLRVGRGKTWTTAAKVSANSPLNLGPGDRTEFLLTGSFGEGTGPMRVRIELVAPAVPPLVWFEFEGRPTGSTSPP